MPSVEAERGKPGERRLCEWYEAGNNGEPAVIFEDGSPAPFDAWEHPYDAGGNRVYDQHAEFNPAHRFWQAGWYPVVDEPEPEVEPGATYEVWVDGRRHYGGYTDLEAAGDLAVRLSDRAPSSRVEVADEDTGKVVVTYRAGRVRSRVA